MSSRRRFLQSTTFPALTAAVAGFTPLARASSVSITVATGHPPVIPWVRVLNDYFIPEVDRRAAAAGHTINWNRAYGGTVVKIGGELEAVQKGIVDMSIVGAPFHPNKLSLLNVAYYTPFAALLVKDAVEVMDSIYPLAPGMRKLWEDHQQVYLNGIGTDNFNLYTKRPVRQMRDLAGMKIGGAGPNLNWLKGSGAAGVVVTPPTIYNDLQNGIYDGVLLGGSQATALKIHEVAPQMLKVDFGAMYWAGLTINKSRFTSMPPDLQQIFRDVALLYRTRLCEEQERIALIGLEGMKKEGLTVTAVDRTARLAWAASLPDIAEEWAVPLEAKGQPARQVLLAWMDGLRSRGNPIARNWGRQ